MTKILVSGQSILAVAPEVTAEAWVCHDQIIPKHVAPGAVLVDATLPEGFQLGLFKWDGAQVVKSPQDPINISAEKAAMIKLIDADADAIYADVVGGRALEYQLAEEDAQAFKDAGYTGDVPAGVSTWAAAKNWPAQQAADDILAVAAAWRQAQVAIRGNRLTRKEEARAAADSAALAPVRMAWGTFVTTIRTQLGV